MTGVQTCALPIYRVKAVADACREGHIPIRIGVNGGSLEKELLKKHGGATPEALAERQLLLLCDEALVTKIDNAFEADAYFPNLDENPEWELIADSEEQTYFDLEYRFLKYRRK